MMIAHVVPLISPDGAFGGPLRVALNQVRELRERGHSVALLAGWREQGPGPKQVDGIDVTTFAARQLVPGTGFSGLSSRGLNHWLDDNIASVDVLHVHAGRDLVSAGALRRGRRARTPTVVQSHGMIAPDRRLRSRLADALAFRRLVGGAALHLVLTDKESEEIPTVLPRATVRRLGNGIKSPGAPYSPPPSRDVLFCARLHRRKRPVEFVAMAQRVADRDPTATFSIIGPDEGELGAVIGLIRDMDLERRVRYEGALPYAEVAARMQRSAVYVLPSVDEPFPMSLLEAMSLGMPCVCTDSCGISAELERLGAAIVTDGSPAVMADAVIRLLDDDVLRAELGARARRSVAEVYSIERVVDDLESYYVEAVKMRRLRSRHTPWPKKRTSYRLGLFRRWP